MQKTNNLNLLRRKPLKLILIKFNQDKKTKLQENQKAATEMQFELYSGSQKLLSQNTTIVFDEEKDGSPIEKFKTCDYTE